MQYAEKYPEPRYRLEDILESIGDDELALELYDEVDSAVGRYWDLVARHEHARSIQQFRLEAPAYRDLHERLDQSRRIAHNALVDKLAILARTAQKSGSDTTWWNGSHGLERGGRVGIAQWALSVEFGRISNRAREEDNTYAKTGRATTNA